MRRRRRACRERANRLGVVVRAGAVVAGASMVAGCGLTEAGGKVDAGKPAAEPAAASRIDCAESGQVPGSGSSAQDNAMKNWIEQYEAACPGVQVAYNPMGSGAGVAQFLRGATAFGGSDSALTSAEMQRSKTACPGGRAIDLPMSGGPIAVSHNLPEVDELVLDAATLAKIFDARITTWDHPDIKKLNPGVDLPSMRVRPVHRSDDSGTTQNLQAYLAGAAPEAWPYPAEKSWQGRLGESAEGSSGVAAAVKSTTGAIGYVELSVAAKRNMHTVSIDTGADSPVAPTPETASAGITEARVAGRGKDMALEFDYGTSAAGAYPIVQITYEIVCDRGNQAATLPALKSFLAFTAGEEGQKALPALHYAPLPDSVAAEIRRVVRTLA